MGKVSNNYFLPYQLTWINDEAPLKIYEKSRRIGITYGTSYRCFRKCLRQPENSNFTQWVSSRDEQTAKEFIKDYVAMWARAANVVAKGLMGDNVQVIDAEKNVTAFVAEFDNGARIVSLSSNPKAFAGKGGDILIDEFDLHRNQGDLYDMAYPCITWGGQLEIVSAYDSDGSEHTVFAQLIKECKIDGNPKGFSLHSTNLLEAVEQGFVEKVNEVKKRKGKPTQTRDEFVNSIKKSCRTHAAYLSQYMCVPNSANGQQAVRANDLLNSKKPIHILLVDLTGNAGVTDITDPIAAPYIDNGFFRDNITGYSRYSMGYDVARKHDLATIWIDGIANKVYRLLALMVFRNCKFETQKQIAESIMRELPIVGAGDETGMGGPNCEHLHTLFPDRFIPVNFSSKKITLGTMLMEFF
jgi:phage FluMu gp28-like protein